MGIKKSFSKEEGIDDRPETFDLSTNIELSTLSDEDLLFRESIVKSFYEIVVRTGKPVYGFSKSDLEKKYAEIVKEFEARGRNYLVELDRSMEDSGDDSKKEISKQEKLGSIGNIKGVDFSSLLEIKRYAEEDGKNIIEGIATTADLDVDDLYISESALIGAENDLKKYTTLLYNHDRDKEIGKILEVKYVPEERALWIKALISKTVPDIWQKIKEGVLNKFSVSGTALDFTEKFIKGLDKVVQYVNQIRLFETSLVTVPADPSSRTLAWYVEKSLGKQFNKENSMSTKEKKVKKSKDDNIKKDVHQIEILISSVEDALSTEDKEIQINALRSALDFLKTSLELENKVKTDEEARGKVDTSGISIDDVKKAMTECLSTSFNELKETLEAFAKSVSEVAKAKADEEVAKAKDEAKEEVEEVKEEVAKAKEEVEEVTRAKEENDEEVAKAKEEEDNKISELQRSLDSLSTLVKDTLPIRKGVGSEEHKEDNRKLTSEDKNLARSEKMSKMDNPGDKLRYMFDLAEEELVEAKESSK